MVKFTSRKAEAIVDATNGTFVPSAVLVLQKAQDGGVGYTCLASEHDLVISRLQRFDPVNGPLIPRNFDTFSLDGQSALLSVNVWYLNKPTFLASTSSL